MAKMPPHINNNDKEEQQSHNKQNAYGDIYFFYRPKVSYQRFHYDDVNSLWLQHPEEQPRNQESSATIRLQ